MSAWKQLIDTIQIGDLPGDIPKTKISSTGQWPTGDIPDLNASKITAGEFPSARIEDGAILEAKIGAGAVTEAKIGAGAVTVNKIGALAVTAAKIAAGAVEENKIDTGAVTENKLGALAVTAAKIAAGAVTEDKIGALAVTNGKIGAGAVNVAKMDIDADLDMGLNQVENFVIELVSSLPTVTQEAASDGRIVMLTTQDGDNKPGLYRYEYSA
jgi:hypothetical protein